MTIRRALMTLLLPLVAAIVLAFGTLGFALTEAVRADEAQAGLAAALAHRPQEPVVQAQALLVPGATAGLAASALQAQVLNLLGSLDVQQIEALGADPGAEGPLTRLRVNVRAIGQEAAVMTSLVALEAAEPLVFVDGLRISALEDGRLTVELDLSGYAGQVAP